MKKFLRKTLCALLIVILTIVSCPQLAIQSRAEESTQRVYGTLEDYLKNYYILEYEGVWIYKGSSGISYEDLDKNKITGVQIYSPFRDEDFNQLSFKMTDLEELYQFPNLETLEISNLEDIQEIDFSKLPNLQSIVILHGTLNGKIDFTKNEKLSRISISLVGDLTNAVILHDPSLKALNYVSITFDYSTTDEFSLEKALPGLMGEYFGTYISGTICQYSWAPGMGGPYSVSCDTLDNYLKIFYPDTQKEEILELDLIADGVSISDFSGIGELKNLRKLTMKGGYDDYLTIIDIRDLEKLEYFKYLYEGCSQEPTLDELIIANDYTQIKKVKTEHSYTEEDGTISKWYYGYYYFNKYIVDENIETEYSETSDKEIIKGFNLTDDKIKVEDILGSEIFTEEMEVKVFDNKNTEITDTSEGLGTGSIIKLYQDGELVQEYTVIIYGDTTGDGEITSLDALTLIKAINKKIELSNEAYWEAGKIMSENTPAAIDALAIVKHLNKKYTINQ